MRSGAATLNPDNVLHLPLLFLGLRTLFHTQTRKTRVYSCGMWSVRTFDTVAALQGAFPIYLKLSARLPKRVAANGDGQGCDAGKCADSWRCAPFAARRACPRLPPRCEGNERGQLRTFTTGFSTRSVIEMCIRNVCACGRVPYTT